MYASFSNSKYQLLSTLINLYQLIKTTFWEEYLSAGQYWRILIRIPNLAVSKLLSLRRLSTEVAY